MNNRQETCVQRVKVVFRNSSGKSAIESEPQSEKIRAMIHLLQKAHEDWSLYAVKHQIVMETTTLDFGIISEMLERNGFPPSDYDVQVEYERKWGML